MAAQPAVGKGYMNIQRTKSVVDLWERSVKMIRGTKVLVDQAKNAKLVLGTSRGRDKICSVIQYVAKFVYVCNVHSSIPAVREEIEYVYNLRLGSSESSKRTGFLAVEYLIV